MSSKTMECHFNTSGKLYMEAIMQDRGKVFLCFKSNICFWEGVIKFCHIDLPSDPGKQVKKGLRIYSKPWRSQNNELERDLGLRTRNGLSSLVHQKRKTKKRFKILQWLHMLPSISEFFSRGSGQVFPWPLSNECWRSL